MFQARKTKDNDFMEMFGDESQTVMIDEGTPDQESRTIQRDSTTDGGEDTCKSRSTKKISTFTNEL